MEDTEVHEGFADRLIHSGRGYRVKILALAGTISGNNLRG